MAAGHRSGTPLSRVRDPEYWRLLCPDLSVGNAPAKNAKVAPQVAPQLQPGPAVGVEATEFERQLRTRMDGDGYFVATAGAGFEGSKLMFEALADAILKLDAAGWPSTFLMVYNEVWQLQESVARLMGATTGNPPNMDMLAFLVDPNKGTAGFSPHRDRQPRDVATSFRDDGSPKYSTCWLALRDATPENSCLYFIPRPADPGYHDGDGDGEHDDMMRDALCTKESYQHIRAIPLKQGEAAFFSHRIIHWGSRGRVGYPLPRLAISFAFSEPGFEPPYISITAGNHPDLAQRLCLAAAQMLVYHERFEPDKPSLLVYEALYKGAAGSLDDSYRRKVNLEFISAVKDAGARATAGPGRCGDGSSAGSGNHPDGAGDAEAANAAAADDDADDADDDSAMDSAMDMMLDAVNDGYGDFEDDYEDDYEEGGSPGTAQHPADDCDADSDDDDEEGGVLGADDDDSDGDADTARKRQKKTG